MCVFNLIALLKQFARKQTQQEVKQYKICYNELTLSLVSLNGLIAYKWLCYYSNHLKSHIGCKCNNNTCVPSFSLVVIIFLTNRIREHTHTKQPIVSILISYYIPFFSVTLNLKQWCHTQYGRKTLLITWLRLTINNLTSLVYKQKKSVINGRIKFPKAIK